MNTPFKCPKCKREIKDDELMMQPLQKDGFICMVCVYESRGIRRDIAVKTVRMFIEDGKRFRDKINQIQDQINQLNQL